MKTFEIGEKKILEFLHESNAIEDVWDEQSLEDAWEAWEVSRHIDKLTVEDILYFHKVLMVHQPIENKYKGALRDVDVMIAGRLGERPERLLTLVGNWVKLVNVTIKMPHSLNENFFEKYIKRDHVQFEKIHPFIDGNGRIGRLLLAWECLKSKTHVPVILEKEKESYYIWFI